DLYKWNRPRCIHFRARGRFPRADHLPPGPLWSRGAWKKQTTLYSWTLRSRPDSFKKVGRASPGRSEEGNGRIERRDAGPGGGTAGAGEVSPWPSSLHKLGYLLHFSLSSAGFVTALSDRFGSGGRFPASSVIAAILPGLLLIHWPVKYPLYARAIDIF